jgi:hypothetical protein
MAPKGGNTMPRLPWVLAASLGFAGSVAAQQGQQQPQVDPKVAVPASVTPASGAQPGPRMPGSGSARNQFFTPVMGIDIKGEGLALPAGVAQPDEPIVKPPAQPPATVK